MDVPLHVMEMPGLYGPYSCHERVLQKVWIQGDFDYGRAVTTGGEKVEIESAGRWNLLGGPDFVGARLKLDGRPVTGDVEVHFHGGDWAAHRHRTDPAYDGVVLHVVLFPPGPDEPEALNRAGVAIPTLVLMPLLLRDLEDYASDDALEGITARDEWRNIEELARQPVVQVRGLLLREAEERWRQKIGFARLRIDRLGWESAAHHTALEILGYRFNRAPMLMLAARHPLRAWARPGCEPEVLLAADGLRWQSQGVRPANLPRVRLAQYRAWACARPDWPAQLWALPLPAPVAIEAAAATRTVRQACGLAALRVRMANTVLAATLAGTRLDNLVCDGFLPLLAARGRDGLFPLWFHWFPGDQPAPIGLALRMLDQTGPARPFCHGLAQGFLGWRLKKEVLPCPEPATRGRGA